MKKTNGELTCEVRSNMAGGTGDVALRHMLLPQEAYGAGRLFAINTLPAGASIGYHRHDGEFEVYYVLEGTAKVTEDGEVYLLHPGEMMQCGDGSSHGIENAGQEDLKIIALILNVNNTHS